MQTQAEPAAVSALHRGATDVSHPITPCPFPANDEEQGQQGAEPRCLSSHENEAGTMRGNNTWTNKAFPKGKVNTEED